MNDEPTVYDLRDELDKLEKFRDEIQELRDNMESHLDDEDMNNAVRTAAVLEIERLDSLIENHTEILDRYSWAFDDDLEEGGE